MRTTARLMNLVIAAAALAGILHAAQAATQSTNGNKKRAFDISRFSTAGNDLFETFHVTETKPLRQALDAGSLKEDSRVLVTETAAGKLALLTDQMAFHHIAQGHTGGKDWMVTF